jgi:hypothetical protein
MRPRPAVVGDVVLFYDQQDEQEYGVLLEIGKSKTTGHRMYVVRPLNWNLEDTVTDNAARVIVTFWGVVDPKWLLMKPVVLHD